MRGRGLIDVNVLVLRREFAIKMLRGLRSAVRIVHC